MRFHADTPGQRFLHLTHWASTPRSEQRLVLPAVLPAAEALAVVPAEFALREADLLVTVQADEPLLVALDTGCCWFRRRALNDCAHDSISRSNALRLHELGQF